MKNFLINILAIIVVAPISFIGVVTLGYAQGYGIFFTIFGMVFCVMSIFLGFKFADVVIKALEK